MYLCSHGGNHQWKRLFWIYDIAQIIKTKGEEFVLEVYKEAPDSRMRREILVACNLANQLLGSSLPELIHYAIQKDRVVKKLTRIALFALEQTSNTSHNPLSSLPAFALGCRKILNDYQYTFYSGGLKQITYSIQKSFVNPNYWRIFAFSDRFFSLNYAIVPLLWVVSVLRKYRS